MRRADYCGEHREHKQIDTLRETGTCKRREQRKSICQKSERSLNAREKGVVNCWTRETSVRLNIDSETDNLIEAACSGCVDLLVYAWRFGAEQDISNSGRAAFVPHLRRE